LIFAPGEGVEGLPASMVVGRFRGTVTGESEDVKYPEMPHSIPFWYMELRHLRYFVAVAEEAHITRAAARLGIQQPPLSKQIRALENELGVELLVRHPRGVALTAGGIAFLKEARAVLAKAERAAASAALAAAGQEGEITLGVTTSAILHPLIAKILRRYVQDYPAVSLKIEEGNAADLTDGLVGGTADAIFLRAVVARPLGITFAQLAEEEMLLAVPRGHRLATVGPVPIEELAGERFILVRRHAAPGMYGDLLEACRGVGFEPHVVAEVGRMLTNINLVAAGVGISVVPASMREIRVDGIYYTALTCAKPLRAPLTLALRSADKQPTVANLRRVAAGLAAPDKGLVPGAYRRLGRTSRR
jgi:DNA-binding transcriptional LysR family regulator